MLCGRSRVRPGLVCAKRDRDRVAGRKGLLESLVEPFLNVSVLGAGPVRARARRSLALAGGGGFDFRWLVGLSSHGRRFSLRKTRPNGGRSCRRSETLDQPLPFCCFSFWPAFSSASPARLAASRPARAA